MRPDIWWFADTAFHKCPWRAHCVKYYQEYLSLKIIVSPRRLVMASRDKEGSHLSGVLGCLGLGSSSPGPAVMKWTEEGCEAGLPDAPPLLVESRRVPSRRTGGPQLLRQGPSTVPSYFLPPGSPSFWVGLLLPLPSSSPFEILLNYSFGFLEVGDRNGWVGKGARLKGKLPHAWHKLWTGCSWDTHFSWSHFWGRTVPAGILASALSLASFTSGRRLTRSLHQFPPVPLLWASSQAFSSPDMPRVCPFPPAQVSAEQASCTVTILSCFLSAWFIFVLSSSPLVSGL